MGAFDSLRKDSPTLPSTPRPIIKARKKLKKGYVMGCISNGDAIIRLDKEYAIKTIALDNQYVELILIDYGKDQKMPTQSWQKTKTVEKRLGNEKINTSEDTEKENLF